MNEVYSVDDVEKFDLVDEQFLDSSPDFDSGILSATEKDVMGFVEHVIAANNCSEMSNCVAGFNSFDGVAVSVYFDDGEVAFFFSDEQEVGVDFNVGDLQIVVDVEDDIGQFLMI